MLKPELSIKILGKTKKEKGDSFERLMKVLLNKLNYTDFKVHVQTIGTEIDIEAIHKTTKNILMCECKAHNEPIGPKPIKKFFADVAHDRTSNKNLNGFFFSISGFSGTAKKWVETLKDVSYFRIFDQDNIIVLFEEFHLIKTIKELDIKMMQLTDHELGERYLIYYLSELYFVQLLLTGGKTTHFILITSNGELIDKMILDEIIELDDTIKSLKSFDLIIIDKVILNLLDLKQKKSEEISIEINETQADVEIVLKELLRKDLIKESEKESHKFNINCNIGTLTKIVKRYQNDKQIFQLMESSFIETIIDDKFINYLEKKFYIKFKEQKEMLINVIKIFPSILYMILLSEKYILYKNNYLQIEKFSFSKRKKSPFHKKRIVWFLDDLLSIINGELEKLSPIYLNAKGVRAYLSKLSLNIASNQRLLFSHSSILLPFISRAGGPIKPGEIVSGDDNTLMDIGIVLMNLKDYNKAIKHFDKIIKLSKDPNFVLAALHNKSSCYLHMKKFKNSIESGNEALTYNSNYIPTILNLIYCYDQIGLKTESNQLKIKLNNILEHKPNS